MANFDLKNTDMSTYKLQNVLKVYYELMFVNSNVLTKVDAAVREQIDQAEFQPSEI